MWASPSGPRRAPFLVVVPTFAQLCCSPWCAQGVAGPHLAGPGISLTCSLGSPCSAEGWGRGHTWCNHPQAATSSRCALPCASQQEACVFTIKGSAGQCRPRRAADPARWRAGSSSCQPSHTPCRRLRLSSSVSGRGFCARAGLSNGDKFLWLFPGEWLPPFSRALGALVHFSSLGSSTPGPVLPRSSEGSAVPTMGRSAW